MNSPITDGSISILYGGHLFTWTLNLENRELHWTSARVHVSSGMPVVAKAGTTLYATESKIVHTVIFMAWLQAYVAVRALFCRHVRPVELAEERRCHGAVGR